MTGHPKKRARGLVKTGSGVDPQTGEWTPTFPGQRPPFRAGEPGPALRHGARSILRLAPRAVELADEYRQLVPAYSVADEPTLQLLGFTMARVEAAAAALDELAAMSNRELGPYLAQEAIKLARLREDCRGWVNTSRRLANDLGMTPTSRAKLGLNLVRTEDHLERLAAEGRAIRERRGEVADA